MNVSNLPSKPLLFTLIGILLVGIPLTLYVLQNQQTLKQSAFSTQQSAVTKCSDEEGSAVIIATFANTESDKSITVTANDLQTGKFINIGTVKPQEVKSADIITGESSILAGSVVFHLTSTDSSGETAQLPATYFAINNCPVTATTFCPDNQQNNQGLCQWEPVDGAKGYNVVVKKTDTDEIVQSVSTSPDATQSAFPMIPGKPYTCTVTPTNECGGGVSTTSPEKTCSTPTPSVSPTPPACVNGSSSQGVCQWDALDGVDNYTVNVTDVTTGQVVNSQTIQAPATSFSFNDNGIDTYECSVTATNVCGNSTPVQSPPSTCVSPTPTIIIPTPTVVVSPTPTPLPSPTPTSTPAPTPTPKPSPTPTPIPTATPAPTATPFPTPTPVVIVRTITQPPQQQIIQTPGQTHTIVQQGPPQTVIVQQPPAQTTPRPYTAVTPVPTVLPTGNTTPTFVLMGTSVILLLAGGIIFFIL